MVKCAECGKSFAMNSAARFCDSAECALHIQRGLRFLCDNPGRRSVRHEDYRSVTVWNARAFDNDGICADCVGVAVGMERDIVVGALSEGG